MSIRALAERAAAVDGVEPFNEASLFASGTARPRVSWCSRPRRDGTISAAAFAVGERTRRDRRRPCRIGGVGKGLLASSTSSLADGGGPGYWAHGDLPGGPGTGCFLGG